MIKNMEPSYESKKLAQCFLVPLGEEIRIPKEIYQGLDSLGKNVVAVVPGDSKKLSFFLTNATQVLFIRLTLNKSSLNDQFFTSLRNCLQDLKMSNLFSTGVCFKEEVCVWEGVFEYDNDENFKIVEEKFQTITHVKKAKFEKIKVSE